MNSFARAIGLAIHYRATLLDLSAGPLADDVLETGWFDEEQLEDLGRRGLLRSKRTEIGIRDWLSGRSWPADLIHGIWEFRSPA